MKRIEGTWSTDEHAVPFDPQYMVVGCPECGAQTRKPLDAYWDICEQLRLARVRVDNDDELLAWLKNPCEQSLDVLALGRALVAISDTAEVALLVDHNSWLCYDVRGGDVLREQVHAVADNVGWGNHGLRLCSTVILHNGELAQWDDVDEEVETDDQDD